MGETKLYPFQVEENMNLTGHVLTLPQNQHAIEHTVLCACGFRASRISYGPLVNSQSNSEASSITPNAQTALGEMIIT